MPLESPHTSGASQASSQASQEDHPAHVSPDDIQWTNFSFCPFDRKDETPPVRSGVPHHPRYNIGSDFEAWAPHPASLWPHVFGVPMFWINVAVLAVCLALFAGLKDLVQMNSMLFPTWLEGGYLTVSVFTVTLYTSDVFENYNRFTEGVFERSEKLNTLAAFMAQVAEVWDAGKAEAVMRFSNLMMHINCMEAEGPMCQAKWDVLLYRGLLSRRELEVLQAYQGNYPAVVFMWSVSILTQAHKDGTVRDDAYAQMLSFLADVRDNSMLKGAAFLQVPRPYFHLMWVSAQTFIFVTTWNTALWFAQYLRGECATVEGMSLESCTAFAVWLVANQIWNIALFFGLYKVAARLSYPFDSDDSAFDLGAELDANWRDGLRLFRGVRRGKSSGNGGREFDPSIVSKVSVLGRDLSVGSAGINVRDYSLGSGSVDSEAPSASPAPR